MKIRLMAEGQDYESLQVGIFTPKAVEAGELGVGEVGFLVANIKKISDAKIGDTITETARPRRTVSGFKALKPMVFAGFYPVEGHEYGELRDALEKLRLNDASFFTSPKPRLRSDSVSAADSSGCSTWKSSRSGSSANSTWTW